VVSWGIARIGSTLKVRNNSIAKRAKEELDLSSVPAHRRADHYLGLRFNGPVPNDSRWSRRTSPPDPALAPGLFVR
jgi:hypothetical protein